MIKVQAPSHFPDEKIKIARKPEDISILGQRTVQGGFSPIGNGGGVVRFIKSQCMGCDASDESTEFAPIFDIADNIQVLLCYECYEDYDIGFEMALLTKLAVATKPEKAKVRKGKGKPRKDVITH
jgi:hypothetical protein